MPGSPEIQVRQTKKAAPEMIRRRWERQTLFETDQSLLIRTSAIWTAFRAAPLSS